MHRIAPVLMAALALALPPLAHASFPGANGPLVVSIEKCYDTGYLAKIPWRGGDLTPITEECGPPGERPPGYAAPDASPDGRTLVAIRRVEHCCPEFVTMDADGSNVNEVPLPQEDVGCDPSAPSFAPSGLFFAYKGDKCFNSVERPSLWVVSLDGSDRRKIEGPGPCPGEFDPCPVYENPSWSPDGRLIAVTLNYVKNPGLWLIRARDGEPVRRIAGARAVAPSWAPDGRRLVFATSYDDTYRGLEGGNLYVVSRDGKRRRSLVHRENVAETQPTWSPNGRWVAWVSIELCCGDEAYDVDAKLWRVRASGGRRHRIIDLPDPYIEESAFVNPGLTWLPKP